jgi:hypothetical protein
MKYDGETHKRFIASYKNDSMGASSYIEYLEGRLDSSIYQIQKLEADNNVLKQENRDLQRHVAAHHIDNDAKNVSRETNLKLLDIESVLKLLRLESYKYESFADMGRNNELSGDHIAEVLARKKGPGPKILKILHLQETKRYIADE